MRKTAIPTFFCVTIAFLLTACGPSDTQVKASVDATIQAMSTPTLTATSTPEPPTATRMPPTATPTKRPTVTPKPSPSATRTPLPPLFPDVEPLGCEMDDFQGVEWCSKYNTPGIGVVKLNPGGDIDFALYVGKGKGSPFMRWDILFAGNDWVFIDAITVLADGERYTIKVDRYKDITTDVSGGTVAEIFDGKVVSKALPLAIAFADEVQVRVSGSGGACDKVLTDREIEIVRRALKSYEDKGGSFNFADIQKAGVFEG